MTRLYVMKEAPGQYAVVDRDKVGGGPVSAAVLFLFKTERDAQRFVRAADRGDAPK